MTLLCWSLKPICVPYRDGDLVLMDAGCEYHGYASDITRTWPVNGTFTEAQRELYDIVLQVQKRCISVSSYPWYIVAIG